ncbi:MAG: Type 1 glutamine amidotransferase-like domain-containing protein [Christensenella sp.]|nr:Type 1 glutamine amidotransferase-like domain-containing protein [Christensenella sp.]
MRLFLTSYLAGTQNLVRDFLIDLPTKEIVFIPTAANVEDYKGYVDEAITAFQSLGFRLKMLDISILERDEILDVLKNCNCLYISGGNTFYLLQELKRKELIGVIKKRILNGMLYIGESAGAIIASADIEYNQIMDDKAIAKELKDYSALSVFNRYVLPHNGEFPFIETTAETILKYSNSLKLLPINNHEAIIVTDHDYMVKHES